MTDGKVSGSTPGINIRAILEMSETVDLVAPYRCVGVGSKEWMDEKERRLIKAFTQALAITEAETRASVIEECAKVADKFASKVRHKIDWTNHDIFSDEFYKLAAAIRRKGGEREA